MSESPFKRSMPALDQIHILFLIYSGAHNAINAFLRAHNILFFVFVVVGILSVELMLWAIYKHWKEGRLVGRMMTISRWAGAFAMFYATAGILAQAQTGTESEWLTIYYQWILPSSAPCMFLFSFLIQSVDPIMNAERDTIAHEHLTTVEEKREVLDRKQLALDHRRNIRRLKAHVQQQRMMHLWKESMSRRTRSLLRKSGRIELPIILKNIGVPVEKASRMRPRWLEIGKPLILPEHAGDGQPSFGGDAFPNHGMIDISPNEKADEKTSGGSSTRESGRSIRYCKGPDCANVLKGRRKDYCSNACKQRAHRMRQRVRENGAV